MIDLLAEISDRSLAVVELSSFQLQWLDTSPHIAVVTNMSPNHLDRHQTFEAYIDAKRRIVSRQTSDDVAVLNCGDPVASAFATATSARACWFGWDCRGRPAATVSNGRLWLEADSHRREIMPPDEIPLMGRHNIENVLAAIGATAVLAVEPELMRRAIANFRGLPHRLQLLRTHAGVVYVEDSIATSPERVATGISAIAGPIVLIAGGRSKRLPWKHVWEAARDKVHALILLGEAADEIEASLKSSVLPRAVKVRRAGSMTESVRLAGEAARTGDTVLLSPGCTSFDMFRDFEDRGSAFASAVESL
jgi:UDP-N-acetylmuramoylalanine--D-glutamate ligase